MTILNIDSVTKPIGSYIPCLIVDNFGYSELFMISASLGIPAIIISYYLSKNNVKV